MALEEIQRVLAKLYTDAVLRERFFADPQRVAEGMGLSFYEAHELAQLSAEQVNFFARSLQRKRLNEACKLLPITHRMMGKRFAPLFLKYANTRVPTGPKKHLEDAIAFSSFLEQVARVNFIIPLWAVELVRYEATCLKAVDPTCWCAVVWFRYPIKNLLRCCTEGNGTPVPVLQPTIALWLRLSRRKRVRHVILSLPRPMITRRWRALSWNRKRVSTSGRRFLFHWP